MVDRSLIDPDMRSKRGEPSPYAASLLWWGGEIVPNGGKERGIHQSEMQEVTQAIG